MIPVRLTLEGIYSYKESQTIEFDHLISSGLFGVFGDTGSGKSTILEAITYALYGETERLNNRDNRAYNMMNLKSNRLYVEFDFRNHEDVLYRATREVKRNQKNFDKVYSPTVMFYEQVEGRWVPLDHSNAERILGLSYNNFKRTIIIPQGQFKEFLELGPADRTRMMKEIFQLHRFDLQDNVKKLRAVSQSKLDHLQGHLQSFENVTTVQIKEKGEALEALVHTQVNSQKIYNEIHHKFQRAKALKQDFVELKTKQESLDKIKQQASYFKELQERVNLFELIENIFTHLLKSESDIKMKLSYKSKKKQESQDELNKKQEQLVHWNASIEKIKEYYQNLSTKRAEERDLKSISEIIQLHSEVEGLGERTRNGEKELTKVQEEIAKYLTEIQKKQEEIATLEQNKIDDTLLFKLQDWFAINKSIQATLKVKVEKLQATQGKLQEHLKLLDQSLKLGDDFQAVYKSKRKEIETDRALLEKKRSNTILQMRLVDHAHALHDGQACPLCGSLEHPDKIKSEGVDSDLKNLEVEIERRQKKEQELFQLHHAILAFQSQVDQFKSELEESQKESNDHSGKFVWDEFDKNQPQVFQVELERSIETNKLIKSIRKELLQKDQHLQELRRNLERYRKALEKLNTDYLTKQTEIKTKESNLITLKSESYQEWSIDQLKEQLVQLIEKNNLVEKEYERLTKELNELLQSIAILTTTVNNLADDEKELAASLKETAEQISQQLANHNISIKQVREVSSWKIDIKSSRQEIEEYKITYQTLNKQITELQQKLTDEEFDEDGFTALEALYLQKSEALKIASVEVVKTQTEMYRLQEEYKKKQAIIVDLEKEQKRIDHLRLMHNLFKSAGFVEYVSSIYLGQLCDIANTRFVRMTRNQLRLVLNDNYEFEIIDNLNEGRSRSVKTLSGGQAFQVSLSLALALAESVQTHAKSDRNFFFIDEGFGTQDSESIQVIFETLLHLNKENKVVGIISHVEELKENVPASLSIFKDSERGSLIH